MSYNTEPDGDLHGECAAEIHRLEKWIADLQSGMYVNCVYCGHQYGPSKTTPVSMADALKAHIEECPKHPMSELKKLFLLTRSALRGLLPPGWDDGVMDHMPGVKAARLALEGAEPKLYICEKCYGVSDTQACKWCGDA
ncbi:hypothetical protein [Bradyrhizobium sp.]